MCRDKMHGGRRCPGNMTQERRNQINARRREMYRQKKEQALSVAEAVSVGSHHVSDAPSVINVNVPEWHSNDISYDGEIKQYPSLGISTQSASGDKASQHFFAQTHVSGKCDATQLDAESYKAFGFSKSDSRTYRDDVKQQERDYYNDWWEACDTEVENAHLSQTEEAAIHTYTSTAFGPINKALRGNSTDLVDKSTDNIRSIASGYDLETYVRENPLSTQLFQRVTTELDSALVKGPGLQRVVYRGLSDKGLENANITREELLGNFEVGKEIVFDDYQSSSLSGNTAFQFAGNNGVMFEIRTPDGLLVETLSSEGGEMEVILPRGSRYLAVGHHQWTNPDTSAQTVDVIQLVAIDDEGNVREQSQGVFEAPDLTKQQMGVK